MRDRWARAGALRVGALLAALGAACALRPGAAAGQAPARPRAVALRLRPHAGDTVRTRFEQTVRVARRDASSNASDDVAPASAMLVIARSIVERVDGNGAVLLAVTDSVAFRSPGAPPAAVERMRRGMQGRRAQMHVAPDGALAASGATFEGGPAGVAAPLRLPGTLPASVVSPGATWRRAMAVPSWGAAAAPPHLDVSFHFDSMTADGARAYISLRGRVHAGATAEDDDEPRGSPNAAAGRVEGALVVDLARGWVVESWATFHLDGEMVSAPGAAPMPVRVVVTQRMRAY